MIRDGDMDGKNITILESGHALGGSLDAAGNANTGYFMRGGRMLTSLNYECLWDLFKTIPTLSDPGQSVYDETVAFTKAHTAAARARLVDMNRARVPVSSMGFSMENRTELFKLCTADEETLGNDRITDWLSASFLETEFWYMWTTTFAFQLWLKAKDVQFITGCLVTELANTSADGNFTVTGLHCQRDGKNNVIQVGANDLVFLQNGSITDASSLGSMTSAPKPLTKHESGGWTLWEQIAKGRPEFGNPAVFNSTIAQSAWKSFTITLKNRRFFDSLEKFTGNKDGKGGLITFKDSNWLITIAIHNQPHFIDQPENVQVFWGYGLYPDRLGNFVPKPMRECTGAEILHELCNHLRFEPDTIEDAICIPCWMPYITSQFLPRLQSDRPIPVPKTSKNFAFISQYVEIADDTVFTVEYSVRAAQMAVYELLKIKRPVPPVTPYEKSFKVQFDAVVKIFK
jgi:oleate hydratase